jgi:hypothetical protein
MLENEYTMRARFLFYVTALFLDVLRQRQATGFQYPEEFCLLIKATWLQNNSDSGSEMISELQDRGDVGIL